MPDQPWQDIAREWVPPFPGDRTVSGYRPLDHDCDEMPGYPDGSDGGWTGDDNADTFDPTPDLTHPPTAREAVARLALFLGAPEDAVAEGVTFYRFMDHMDPLWELRAGRGFMRAWHMRIDTDSRPLAIALAWREARQRPK